MPSLLFANHADPQTVGEGTFSCPFCGIARHYARVTVRHTISMLGLRVPAGNYGEYIECDLCLSTYRPEVLAYDAGDHTPRVMSEYQRALRRVLALLVITDGRIHEQEIESVRRIFEAVTGAELTRDDVLEEANAVAHAPMTAARYLAQVIGYLNDHGKEQVLRGAAMVSSADGHIHDSEANMVRRLGAVMQLQPQRIDAVLAAFA